MPPDVRRGKAFGAQSGQITAKVSPKCFAQPPRETRATDLQPVNRQGWCSRRSQGEAFGCEPCHRWRRLFAECFAPTVVGFYAVALVLMVYDRPQAIGTPKA
jgi:hypothetical protein